MIKKRKGLLVVVLSLSFTLWLSPPCLAVRNIPVNTLGVIVGDEIMGRLNQPSGLFFDEIKNRLYVADSGNKRLLSFDKEYKFLAELSHDNIELPMGMVKNKAGHFFVVDGAKGKILFVDIKNKLIEPFLLTGVPKGKEMFVPGRIAIDEQGLLYIIDKLNKRILVVDGAGVFKREITVVDDEGFFGFTDVRVDERGYVYALDTLGGRIYIFDKEGNFVLKFGSRDEKRILFPTSIAVGKNGFIYVTDGHAGRIMVFDGSGTLQHYISRKGVKEGELSHPSYIFIDSKERIYTIDGTRIQIFKEIK